MFQVMSAREKKLQTDDCTRLTEHLLMVLPQLLSKVFIPHITVNTSVSQISVISGNHVMITSIL